MHRFYSTIGSTEQSCGWLTCVFLSSPLFFYANWNFYCSLFFKNMQKWCIDIHVHMRCMVLSVCVGELWLCTAALPPRLRGGERGELRWRRATAMNWWSPPSSLETKGRMSAREPTASPTMALRRSPSGWMFRVRQAYVHPLPLFPPKIV